MTEERYRVLVVDDEEVVANLLGRRLAQSGFEVSTANSGAEALSKISQLDFSTVLLDMRMPGMSGIDVLRRLTVDRPEICIIMVTAVDDATTAVEAMKLGAYDYVIKPFNLDDVVLRVRRAVEKSNLRREAENKRLELERKVLELTGHLQQRFGELVETLAREHKLIYQLAERQRGGGKSLLSQLPPELQTPMSSVEEFSEALLKILRRGAKPGSETSGDRRRGK